MQNGERERNENDLTFKILSSAVFTWTNLLVVVAELDGGENEALDLVPLVTNVVLEVSDAVLYFLFSLTLSVLSFTNVDLEIS